METRIYIFEKVVGLRIFYFSYQCWNEGTMEGNRVSIYSTLDPSLAILSPILDVAGAFQFCDLLSVFWAFSRKIIGPIFSILRIANVSCPSHDRHSEWMLQPIWNQ